MIKEHPVYRNYGANKDGDIFKLDNKKKYLFNPRDGRYPSISLYKDGKSSSMITSRFIFECFNGLLDKCYVIDHINNNKYDNKLSNLQKMTQKENIKKKYIGGIHYNNIHKNIKAINMTTKKSKQFKSMNNCARILQICMPSIRRCCEKIQKTAISKINGQRYSFKYIKNIL